MNPTVYPILAARNTHVKTNMTDIIKSACIAYLKKEIGAKNGARTRIYES